MRIIVNGQPHELDDAHESLEAALMQLPPLSPWHVVVVNAQIVPRGEHAAYVLPHNARVEIVSPMQGG